jgi:hypothetical protein
VGAPVPRSALFVAGEDADPEAPSPCDGTEPDVFTGISDEQVGGQEVLVWAGAVG